MGAPKSVGSVDDSQCKPRNTPAYSGVKREVREIMQSQKAALVRRTLHRLGRTQSEIAAECGTTQQVVASWQLPHTVASPTLLHLLSGAQDMFDEFIAAACEIRERNGFPARRLIAVDAGAECVPRETKQSRVERLARGIAGLTELLTELRGER